MKKLVFLISAIFISVFLVACGDEASDSNDDTVDANEDEESSKNGVSDTEFDNGDYVYEIIAVEQITSKDEDAQILAVELSFTNNTDEPIDPWMAMGLSAEQETEATVEGLDGANGLFPDDYKGELVEMGDTDVKPGATVDAVIGFEILYPGESVKLYNFSYTDEVLFEKTVDTTK